MTTANGSRRNTRKLSRKFSLSKTRKNYSNIKNKNGWKRADEIGFEKEACRIRYA